jgi:hypothetical protein
VWGSVFVDVLGEVLRGVADRAVGVRGSAGDAAGVDAAEPGSVGASGIDTADRSRFDAQAGQVGCVLPVPGG